METTLQQLVEEIKNLPIKSILNHFTIKYREHSGTLHLFENGKETDGWKADVKQNIVTSFSGKNRPQGNPIDFIMGMMNFNTFKQVVDYCAMQGFITIPEKKFQEKQKEKGDYEKVCDYLISRKIDPTKLFGIFDSVKTKVYHKGKSWVDTCIKLEQKNGKGEVIGVQMRGITEKGFASEGRDGFFVKTSGKIKTDRLFIVEGMTDFLTLRQYTENVIGFKSGNTPPDKDLVKFIGMFDSIFLLFDSDDTGREASGKLKNFIPECKLNEFPEGFPVKDINELAQNEENLLEAIENYTVVTQKPAFEHVTYDYGLYLAIQELEEASKEQPMEWGWEEFDRKLGTLQKGQMILIGGQTGMGKSTFLNHIAYNLSEQGFRVARYSLEDRLEERKKEEIYYTIGRIRANKGRNNYPKNVFEIGRIKSDIYKQELQEACKILREKNKNVFDLNKNRVVGISDIERLITKENSRGTNVFIIDHLHYFKMDVKTDRRDLVIEDVMHRLNELCRNLKIVILLSAHYAKLNGKRPTNESFKDANAITQIPNKVIHVWREQEIEGEKTIFLITKSRGLYQTGEIEAFFNIETSEYNMKKSTLKTNWKF